MAAASSTAYSPFSTSKTPHGVQISNAVVRKKQHKIVYIFAQLIFPYVECHMYFENLGHVSH